MAAAPIDLAPPVVQSVAVSPGRPAQSDHDRRENPEIVITGMRRQREDILGGVSVLSSEELTRELRPTIGETLQRQPGVSATSFGPNASRPILRGLGGDRIRILTDGIGSLDVSSTSADHAVAINPLTADRIEVLRGPAALLFGSSAIGGVVNIIDSRIPRHEPEEPLHLDLIGTLASAPDERAVNARVDVPVVSKLVLHGDASFLETNDLEIGGAVLSKGLRRQALSSAVPEIRELARLKDRLPNSAARSWELAGGLAWVDGPLNLGFSIARLDNDYGVPIRYALDPGGEAEAVTIALNQTRYDARAEIPMAGFVEQLRLRGGVVDYRHDEVEESGEIGSSFYSDGAEGRIEAVQRQRGGWGGGFGVQYLWRRIRIAGEEKFLPANRQRQFGLFALQHYQSGKLRAEVGTRIEFSRLDARADADLGNDDLRRSFTAFSGSVGASRQLGGSFRAGANLSYSERAPSVDELFANGPHAGTQAFEIGDPGLDKEKSVSLEATLRRSLGRLTFAASLFHTRFSSFIFPAPTGGLEDGLPVYHYHQGKARFTGFEAEARAEAGRVAGVDWAVEAVADSVRATVTDFGPAPQIPPFRLLGAFEGSRGPWVGRLEIEHGFAQRRNAPVETETDGYTLINASVSWRPIAGRPDLRLSIAANNIFDVTGRRHTSLLKDFAPLGGRDVRLTSRLAF